MMKNWDIRYPWHKGLSMILVIALTISLFGCANNRGQNLAVQPEHSAMELTDRLHDDSAAEISGVLSDRITQDIRLANANLISAIQSEQKAMDDLSDAVATENRESASKALAALTEYLSASDEITEQWLSTQEQAEEEIKAEISDTAKNLLTERAEALRAEINNKKSQTGAILTVLEQALGQEDWEGAEGTLTELKAVLEAVSPQQSYGTKETVSESGNETISYRQTTTSHSLTPGEETDIDEDVKELAEELGTPLEVYSYLKNTIHYEYYYGSRKGANGTYHAYAGNDYDQASLLIGILRYLGYEAEYVRGNILLEEEQALALTGADTFAHAADVLASAGVPVTKYTRNGEIIKIQMEHIWVRALLPYTDYRGAGNAAGEMLWVDLDTGIKAYENVNNLYDMADGATLPPGLADAVEAGDEASIEAILNGYADTVTAMNPDTVYVRRRAIKQEALSYLPASLQYKVEKELDTFSEIGNADKDSISFAVCGETLGTYTASELAGKSILLTFLPASAADAELLNSYDTIFDVPASYVYLKPALIIDGKLAAEAEDVETTLGTAYSFTITLNHARTVSDKVKTVQNTVTVGSMYAVTIDNQMITGDELRQIYGEVTALAGSVHPQNVYSTDYLGRYLSLAGRLYFAEIDLYNVLSGEIYGVCNTRKLSEGITGYEVQRIARYGIITGLAAGSMYIDVDADDHAVISLTGDEKTARAYMMAAGNVSSLYESIVWEQLTGYESVSTMSVFRKAKEEGIELLQFSKDNLEAQMAKLNTDDGIKQAIRTAVTNGSIVTIPAEDVTIGGWSGTGYIILDPTSGAGSYMISGGRNGGEIPIELTMEVIAAAIVAVMGAATLISVLSVSIFAAIFPVATIVAYTALILITTIWIVDMYCSYYDYIYSGNLESYSDAEMMAFQLYLLADMDLLMSQFIFANYAAPYLQNQGEDVEEPNSIFSEKVTVDTAKESIKDFQGKSAEEIAEMMRSQGYDVVIRKSNQSSSRAVIIEVTNVSEAAGRNVMQVQVSPGGGRHGALPYVKISTVSSDVGKIKLVMGPEELYNPSGEKRVTVIFLGDE